MQPGHVGNIRWFIINSVPEYNALNYLTTAITKQAVDMPSCIVMHGVYVQIVKSVGN